MRRLTLLLLAIFATNTWAAEDLTGKMNALGANKALMKKAKAIDPHNRVRVVQNREVDRHMRLEIGLNYGMAAGGDPYVATNVMGGQLDFHINPRFSIGARYLNNQNSLNAEGKKVFEAAEIESRSGSTSFRKPGTDFAKDEWLAVGNWYPIYGKLSWFGSGISQFDVYLLGGGGQINLTSGTAPVYTAGAGVGVWFSQHFATRLEARWQGYQDRIDNGIDGLQSRDINQTMLTATVSFLL